MKAGLTKDETFCAKMCFAQKKKYKLNNRVKYNCLRNSNDLKNGNSVHIQPYKNPF